MFRFPVLKLSTKLILLFFTIIVLHAIVSLLSLTYIISRTNMNSMELQIQRTTDGVNRYLSKIVNDLQVKAKLFSGQDKIINYTEYGLYNMLRRQLVVYWESLGINTIAIFSDKLEPIASIGEKLVLDRRMKSTLGSSLEGKTLRFFTMGEKHPLLLVTLPVKRDYKSFAVMAIGITIDDNFISALETIFSNHIVFRINNTVVSYSLDSRTVHDLITYSPKDRIGPYLIKRIPSSFFYISGGIVYCLYDTSAVLHQIKGYSIISIMISLFILFAALFTGLVFYRRTFLKPFNALMNGINQISEGNIAPPFSDPGRDEFGELAGAFNLMCTNLVKREEEISRLSSYNSLILDNMKSGLITFGLDGSITTINPAARKILLSGEIDGEDDLSSLLTRFPEEFNSLIRTELEEGKYKSYGELTLHSGNQDKIISYRFSPLVSEEGAVMGIIIIFEDVTIIRNLEEKLIVSSRLAVLGEMAAGVAHQIKNPLAVMKVSMEMLVDDLAYPESDTETGDLSGFILNEIDTLDSVVNNFLAFAKPKRGVKTYEDVDELIDFSIRCIPVDKYEGISVRKSIPGNTGKYLFDRNLMVQALSNIIINAFQSSESGDTVFIRTCRDGKKLVIEIEDEGTGMDEATMSKIYNPFFTTKENGTGLGLSIVHRIVEDEGGRIEVESRKGTGTIFRLIFGENE